MLVILPARPDLPACLHPSPRHSVSWETELHWLTPWISLSSSSQLGLTHGKAQKEVRGQRSGYWLFWSPPCLAMVWAVAPPTATAPLAATGLTRDQKHCLSSYHLSPLRFFIILCQFPSPFTLYPLPFANSSTVQLTWAD